MASKRIMLLGSNGQIGQALRAQTPSDWKLHAFGHSECDITDHATVQKTVQSLKPDLVINSAAMTAVDKCETEQEQAAAANFDGAANLATQCSAIDAPLIHLSTDFVFDGMDGGIPYMTHDKMSPPNIYGHTKMMGEEAVRHAHPWHVILRISSVFGAFGSNLLTRTLESIDKRDEIKAVTDQISGPTPAQHVAEALITMTNALLSGKADGFGTFHLCGEPAADRLTFVNAVMKAYAPFTARRPKILPALSAEFAGFAPRPPYSVLDCSKTHEVYGIQQKPWQDGLAEAMEVLMQGRRKVA